MKLATIGKSENVESNRLRILLGDQPDAIVENIIYRVKYDKLRPRSIPYLFIESAFQIIESSTLKMAVVLKLLIN